MSTVIQKEVILDKSFTFLNDENSDPAIEFGGQTYKKLADLTGKIPFLSDKKHLKEFVRIANFLFTGQEFAIIDDVAAYQKRYRANAGKLTSEYGIYDVSSIKDPFLENGKVIFYAEKKSSGVPYKVICTYPYTDENAECAYTLLPALG